MLHRPSPSVYVSTGTNVVFSPGPAFYFGSVLAGEDGASEFKMVFWDIQRSAKVGEVTV